jgi:hypothetical protein
MTSSPQRPILMGLLWVSGSPDRSNLAHGINHTVLKIFNVLGDTKHIDYFLPVTDMFYTIPNMI